MHNDVHRLVLDIHLNSIEVIKMGYRMAALSKQKSDLMNKFFQEFLCENLVLYFSKRIQEISALVLLFFGSGTK